MPTGCCSPQAETKARSLQALPGLLVAGCPAAAPSLGYNALCTPPTSVTSTVPDEEGTYFILLQCSAEQAE